MPDANMSPRPGKVGNAAEVAGWLTAMLTVAVLCFADDRTGKDSAHTGWLWRPGAPQKAQAGRQRPFLSHPTQPCHLHADTSPLLRTSVDPTTHLTSPIPLSASLVSASHGELASTNTSPDWSLMAVLRPPTGSPKREKGTEKMVMAGERARMTSSEVDMVDRRLGSKMGAQWCGCVGAMATTWIRCPIEAIQTVPFRGWKMTWA